MAKINCAVVRDGNYEISYLIPLESLTKMGFSIVDVERSLSFDFTVAEEMFDLELPPMT